MTANGCHLNHRCSNFAWLFLTILAAMFLAGGCAAPQRHALPEALSESARIPGIPYAYQWGDKPPSYVDEGARNEERRSQIKRLVAEQGPSVLSNPINYLAISGGGSNGAFGAGLLNGWTASGTRPEFNVVTGISTGAIIAPFAFLGSEYDEEIKSIYTQYDTGDALIFRSLLTALMGESAADASGMKTLIEAHVSDAVIRAVAKENEKGRLLLIGTTNLDAGRSVIWNIGEIAATGSQEAYKLIRDIILASASIPGVFPPVMIQCDVDGQGYDEMHVDGGVSRQVFLFPAALAWHALIENLGFTGKQNLYVIRNSKLTHEHHAVKRSIFSVAARSIGILTTTQGIGDLYQLYLIANKNDIDYNLAFIPSDFKESPEELFDPDYMQKLFALGYKVGSHDSSWQDHPPGFADVSATESAH